MAKQSVPVERPLSPSEKIFWIADQRCSSNFVVHAGVTGAITEDLLQQSLSAVQRRHPLLRVRIQREGWNTLLFRTSEVPPIPLRVVNAPLKGWVDAAENELHQAFPVDKGPLARCTLVRHAGDEATVLLAFHHSIGDAMSGSFLMRDLFQAAALASAGKACELPPLKPKQEMNAYFPDWAVGKSGRWRSLKFGGRMYAAALRYGRPTLPRLDEKARPKARQARIVAHQLDPDMVDRLHERARKAGTTLHGAMLAAQILAIAQDRQESKERPYFVGSPVNLRKRLHPPVGEDVGFFVTIAASVNMAGPRTLFWPLAKAVRDGVWYSVERGEPFVYVVQHLDLSRITGILGLGPLGRWASSRVGSWWSFGGLVFSNIGKVDIEGVQGPFIIQDLGFAASLSFLSRLGSFAATIKRRSTWNFVGMDPLLTREHTRQIADTALEILKKALES